TSLTTFTGSAPELSTEELSRVFPPTAQSHALMPIAIFPMLHSTKQSVVFPRPRLDTALESWLSLMPLRQVNWVITPLSWHHAGLWDWPRKILQRWYQLANLSRKYWAPIPFLLRFRLRALPWSLTNPSPHRRL